MHASGLGEEEFARAVGYPDTRAVREVLAGGGVPKKRFKILIS